MTKQKEKAKSKAKKSSQLVLRVEKHEKDAFIAACEALDSSAGKEIRRFMREFLAERSTGVPDVAEKTETAADVTPIDALVPSGDIGEQVEKPKVTKRAKPVKKSAQGK